MQETNKPQFKIGISIGDVNGVGLEVILKTLSDERVMKYCTPIIYGSSKVVSYHRNIVQIDLPQYFNIRNAKDTHIGAINILNCWQENVNITIGQATDVGGKYAIRSLEKATADLQAGMIDGLVTAPINKEAMQLSGFQFPGHTEYLTDALDVEDSLMFMISDSLKVGLVTNHVPVKDVAKKIHKELILSKIEMMAETLKVDFGIAKPKIGVLALNPHASDGGLIGDEEQKHIIPAVELAKQKGILAIGPYSADGFFGSGQYAKFDAILAMYHDQGLIPFKALSFGSGVNYTAGLPKIRTSPDHGTGFDIAGSNLADPASFRKALFLAIDINKNRSNYIEMHANPVRKKGELNQEDEDISSLPQE